MCHFRMTEEPEMRLHHWTISSQLQITKNQSATSAVWHHCHTGTYTATALYNTDLLCSLNVLHSCAWSLMNIKHRMLDEMQVIFPISPTAKSLIQSGFHLTHLCSCNEKDGMLAVSNIWELTALIFVDANYQAASMCRLL